MKYTPEGLMAAEARNSARAAVSREKGLAVNARNKEQLDTDEGVILVEDPDESVARTKAEARIYAEEQLEIERYRERLEDLDRQAATLKNLMDSNQFSADNVLRQLEMMDTEFADFQDELKDILDLHGISTFDTDEDINLNPASEASYADMSAMQEDIYRKKGTYVFKGSWKAFVSLIKKTVEVYNYKYSAHDLNVLKPGELGRRKFLKTLATVAAGGAATIAVGASLSDTNTTQQKVGNSANVNNSDTKTPDTVLESSVEEVENAENVSETTQEEPEAEAVENESIILTEQQIQIKNYTSQLEDLDDIRRAEMLRVASEIVGLEIGSQERDNLEKRFVENFLQKSVRPTEGYNIIFQGIVSQRLRRKLLRQFKLDYTRSLQRKQPPEKLNNYEKVWCANKGINEFTLTTAKSGTTLAKLLLKEFPEIWFDALPKSKQDESVKNLEDYNFVDPKAIAVMSHIETNGGEYIGHTSFKGNLTESLDYDDFGPPAIKLVAALMQALTGIRYGENDNYLNIPGSSKKSGQDASGGAIWPQMMPAILYSFIEKYYRCCKRARQEGYELPRLYLGSPIFMAMFQALFVYGTTKIEFKESFEKYKDDGVVINIDALPNSSSGYSLHQSKNKLLTSEEIHEDRISRWNPGLASLYLN